MRLYAIALIASQLLFTARRAGAQDIQPSDLVLIRQLPPSQFATLPAKFRQELESRGCRIPQTGASTEPPMNVIAGNFARKDQLDWAALCHKGGQSSIVIFWGKPTRCASELAVASDGDSLTVEQSRPFRRLTFARQILWISRDAMKEMTRDSEAGGGHWVKRPPGYPTLAHVGIEDAVETSYFVHIHYCSGGNWYTIEYTGE
jgi:hypothetical protein